MAAFQAHALLVCACLWAVTADFRWVHTPSGVLPLPGSKGTGAAGAAKADTPDDYRLPNHLTVSSYHIVIKPDFTVSGDVSTFSGEVLIRGTYLENTKRTTLHAGNNLRIFSVTLDSNNNNIEVLSTERDTQREFLHIDTEFGRSPNTGINITIGFTGTFTGDMHGFYKVFFTEAGKQSLMLATQFEPTLARTAFPCFDEPARKATFHLTLYAPKGYGALSNTPLDKAASSWGSSEATKFVFKTTPKMSPHLLAFLLYPEDSYGRTPFGVVTHSDVTIFSWSMKSDISAGRADFGLLNSPATLGLLEDYVDTPYAVDYINKIDQAVVPGFGHQARENWGLVQYRADRLLVDPQEGTELEKEAVAEFMARELSHAWFGDRLSPEWWNFAWVEEAVDALLQYLCVDRLQPSWRLLERLEAEQQQSALAQDASADALSLVHNVASPQEIAGSITPFVRRKGASIMQMIRNLIGDEAMRNALRSFFKDNTGSSKNGVVSTAHLGAALQKHKPGNVSTNLATFLTSWSETPGYPVVTVERNYSAGYARFKQERFLYSSLTGSKEEYTIPVTISHGGRIERAMFSSTLYRDGFQSTDWLHLEPAGYYRVNYDAQNWELLRQTLEESPERLSPTSRAQLLDDAQALARSGRLTYDTALRVLAALHREEDLVPWEAALPALRFLDRGLVHVDETATLKRFTLYLLSGVYARVGWGAAGSEGSGERSGQWSGERSGEGDGHLDAILRSYVLRVACRAGDEDCLANCTARFEDYLAGHKPAPDVRDAVVCYGVQGSGQSEWAAAAALLRAAQGEAERRAILKGLGCSQDENILKQYLKWSISGEDLKHNEKALVFSSVYANAMGVDIVLDSLLSDFDGYLASFGGKVLGSLIEDFAQYLNTDQQIAKLRQLAGKHPEMGRELSAALTTASDNALWVLSYGDTVLAVMQDITPVSTSSSAPATPTTPFPSTADPVSTTPSTTSSTPLLPLHPPPGGSRIGLVVCIIVIVAVMVLSSILVVIEIRKGTAEERGARRNLALALG